jgi:hypothetical protein
MKKQGLSVIKSRKDKKRSPDSPNTKNPVLITPSDITRIKHELGIIKRIRPMKREEVYKLVDGERDYQEKKWNSATTTSGGQHSACEWLTYIQDYLTEAIHDVSRNPDPAATTMAMENIRKITAMGVAAMEQIETQPRK